MEEKHLKQLETDKEGTDIKNWIISIFTNIGIAALVLLFTNMAYETNDDYAISIRIAGGYPYVGFVNYYICRFLIAIQAHVEKYNVYVLFLVIISLLSFIYLSKIVLDKTNSKSIRVILLAFLILFSFDHYCAIQFTKTAALVLTVGFISLVDSIAERKTIPSYAIAIALIYIGAAIRYEAYFVSLGMAIISAITWLLVNINRTGDEKGLNIKNVGSALLVIILVFGAFGFIKLSDRQNASTPELKYATEYNLYRTNIVDFPTYDYYEQNKQKYDAIGISQNDLFLITKWVFDYDGAASIEKLKSINEIERPQPSIIKRGKRSVKKSLRYVLDGVTHKSSNGIHVVLLSLLAIAMFILLKPKHWLYVIVIGGTAMGVYMSLYFIQRVNYRSFYIADVGAAFWLVYYFASHKEEAKEGLGKKAALIMSVIILASSIASIVPLAQNCRNKYERAAKAIMSEEAEAFFREHKNNAFVWATGEKKYARRYATPMLVPDGSDDNVFNTGSWNVLTPFVLNKLEEHDMHNPIKDLINNDNAYFISNKLESRITEYYKKWYTDKDTTIQLRQVNKIDGQSVWKVERIAK